MQQTIIDSYLRKKFVYVTYVFCNTLPRDIPNCVKLEETNEEMGGKFLYRFTATSDKALTELTARLEIANITYTSRIADQKGMQDKMFNNPNKSFTMQIAWVLFIIVILTVIFSGLPGYYWRTLSAEDETVDKKKPPSSKIVDFLTK